MHYIAKILLQYTRQQRYVCSTLDRTAKILECKDVAFTFLHINISDMCRRFFGFAKGKGE